MSVGSDDAELLRLALRKAADRRHRAKREYDQAQRSVVTLVSKVKVAGMPVSEIADILGITRRGVYFLIRGNAGRES